MALDRITLLVLPMHVKLLLVQHRQSRAYGSRVVTPKEGHRRQAIDARISMQPSTEKDQRNLQHVYTVTAGRHAGGSWSLEAPPAPPAVARPGGKNDHN